MQVVHYIYCWLCLTSGEEENLFDDKLLCFYVPTGAGGHLTAGMTVCRRSMQNRRHLCSGHMATATIGFAAVC